MNSPRKINVLHFIHSLEVGGAEKNLLSIMRAQSRDKFNVFLAFSMGGELEEEFKTTHSFLYKFQSSRLRFRDFRNIAVVSKLSRFIKKHQIDLIHTHAFVPHLWGLVAAKLTNIPIVNHIHDSPIYSASDGNPMGVKGHPTLEKLLTHLTDVTIVVTKGMHKRFMDLGFDKKKILFIPNGIDLPQEELYSDGNAKSIRDHFGISTGPVVCTVGRLDKNKNQQILLRSAATILRDLPRAKFLIVGDGPSKAELEDLSRKLNLTGSVIFPGYRKDIYSILAITDIFVLPSLWELHPITILEAMAMKKPVIASAVGGIPDTVIHGKTGLLVPPNDEAALKDAIIQLLHNRDRARRMGMEGYLLVKENFSNKKVIKTIEKVYLEILKRKNVS